MKSDNIGVKVLEYLGMLFGVIGALMIATKTPYFDIAYCSFLSSSLIWMTLGIITKSAPLFIMNVVFCVINMIRLYNYLIVT